MGDSGRRVYLAAGAADASEFTRNLSLLYLEKNNIAKHIKE